jgi:hypothetical protein
MKHGALHLAIFLLGVFSAAYLSGQEAGAVETAPAATSFFSTLSYIARGTMLVFPEQNGNESDVSPVLGSLGTAVDIPLLGPRIATLGVEASLDFYFTDYTYSDVLQRAVPAAVENRAAFSFGTILGITALGRFDFTDTMTLRLYGGPAADLRIIVLSYNLDENEIDSRTGRTLRQLVGDVRHYFWDQGRWFLPVVGVGFDYRILPGIRLGIDTRVWFPVYKLWTHEGPAIEGWRFGAGVTITFR